MEIVYFFWEDVVMRKGRMVNKLAEGRTKI